MMTSINRFPVQSQRSALLRRIIFDVSGAGVFLVALMSVSSGCKERKPDGEANESRGLFSATQALDKVANLTGRKTVDSWHLAGSDYSIETDGRSDAARRGRDLWFLSTGGNSRFMHRTLASKLGVRVPWNEYLGEKTRGKRFEKWGAIGDPDCRAPRNEYESALSYGWDICPGDLEPNGLLSFVGRPDEEWEKRDPACKFRERDAVDSESRGESCSLAFGTSTGAVGWRKFPNPNFKADRWSGWNNYQASDISEEPPFLIGISCAGCHAGFNPEKLPENFEAPSWQNIHGLVGNRFLKFGEIFGNALPKNSLTGAYMKSLRPGMAHQLIEIGRVGEVVIPPPSAVPAVLGVVYEGDEDRQVRVMKAVSSSGVCFESCDMKSDKMMQECNNSCAAWGAYSRRFEDLDKYLDHSVSLSLSRALKMSESKLIESNVIGGQTVWHEGQAVFAKNCATCHSGGTSDQEQKLSQIAEKFDFFSRNREGHRADVLSDGGHSSALTLGANRCGSRRELYKNTSLLGVWSRAPLLKNRTLGVENCNSSRGSESEFIACGDFRPTVEQQLQRFDAAMDEFLYPEKRTPVITRLPHSATIEFGGRNLAKDAISVLFTGDSAKPELVHSNVTIMIPAGLSFATIRNFDAKQWYEEVAAAKATFAKSQSNSHLSIQLMLSRAALSPGDFLREFGPWIKCIDDAEEKGHERYLPKTQEERLALKAFLKTL